ncbi:Cof-type HAD-IIB family hydrolase [Clostridium sp. 'White wine YQ']|uniref:Cof-type HAD-IIB family hydrolase n=1 Tax=Clostridium sp. 'White wine YQ' TaxID=3027474 RepID=UPI00236620E1|nr:Cof-type HAD-IIB family hydrolase [Clostridium sp. 'White wine YQ']MDD7792819.1 Cof-type HAD-IIB family hydrolase [Clostridium sp. 'White wine YQ']
MKYKLICIDMDGTLLNSRKKISNENKECIKKAKEKGVVVAISTGRIYNNAAFYADYIDLKAPIIAANGAIIIDKDGGEIFKGVIGYDTSLKILDILKKYKLTPHFHTRNAIYSGSAFQKLLGYVFSARGIPVDYKISLKSIVGINKWKKLLNEKEEEILKCITFSLSLRKINRAKEELRKIPEIEVTSSYPFNIEINAAKVSKGNGVKILSEHLGIKREEVICVGDNENDISMIEYAGLGVAMGNASTSIKEKADFVTTSNDNSGVGYAIRKFILEEKI